jgi:hypothetical protein
MNIIVNQRQKAKPNYFVYYNDWTGEILSVGTAIRSGSPATYLETDNPIASDILKGLASNQNYIVCDGLNSQKELVGKSEFLRLSSKENQLFLLPPRANKQWDIRIRLFTANNKLVIEANQTSISKLVSLNAKKQIKLGTKTDFEFYVVRNNEPDYLIDIVKADAEGLINDGCVCIDAGHLIRHAGALDLAILTRRYFENYYFEVVDEMFVEPITATEKSSAWGIAGHLDSSHIELVQQGKYLAVYSKVSADQLFDQAGLWQPTLNFFVVDETPDHYIDMFSVNVSRLRTGQPERYQIDFDIDQVELIYANPRLRVSKRKIE